MAIFKRNPEETLKEVKEVFNKHVEFNALYGKQQGGIEHNRSLYWYGLENMSQATTSWLGTDTSTDFIFKDISRSELVYQKFIGTIKMLNRTAFGEEFVGDDATKYLKDALEAHLFNGQVAVFREPKTGEIVASSFTYDTSDLMAHNNLPTKVRIVSDKAIINGIELKIKNVALGWNNSNRVSEIAYDLTDIEMIINSTMSLSMAIKKSKPKTLIAGDEDNTLAADIYKAITSDNWIEYVPVGVKELQQMDIRFDTGFKEKMEMVIASVSQYLKWKGWETNGLINKKERQTEHEISNNDEFKHFLIWNKIVERKELAEQMKEKLGMNIEYDGNALLDLLREKDESCEEQDNEKQEA